MWPETHHLVGLDFTLYDVMRGVAIVLSALLCMLLNRRQGIPVRVTLAIAVACAPIGIASARVLNCIEFGATWHDIGMAYSSNPGSSVYGALIGAIIAATGMTHLLGISTLKFIDAAAAPFALGEALSRIGCFCAGCCYGIPWHGLWAVIFPDDSFAAIDQRNRGLIDSSASHPLPVHPVQLYSALLMLLLTWGLVRRFGRPHHPGVVFFWLLIGYGAYRLAIAPFRMEALSSMKTFSLLFIAAGLAGLIYVQRERVPVDVDSRGAGAEADARHG